MTILTGMIELLEATIPDAEKHGRGNSAAGTRIRKVMQEVKVLAQEIRVQIQKDKSKR